MHQNKHTLNNGAATCYNINVRCNEVIRWEAILSLCSPLARKSSGINNRRRKKKQGIVLECSHGGRRAADPMCALAKQEATGRPAFCLSGPTNGDKRLQIGVKAPRWAMVCLHWGFNGAGVLAQENKDAHTCMKLSKCNKVPGMP